MISNAVLGSRLCCGPFLLIVVVALAGCGGSSRSSYQVAGTVTFDGEKVERGAIVFTPLDNTTHAGAAQIVNGDYAVELPPGTYRVEITANREHPTKRDRLDMSLIEQYIPANYNTDSQLSLEVVAVDQHQDWPLQSPVWAAGQPKR